MDNESIIKLAANLGDAIRADERMVRMEKAKAAYESSSEIFSLLTEYRVQKEALTNMGDGEHIDTDAVTRIQDRIDELYDEITSNPLFIELDNAQTEVNELMASVNNTIMYHATGEVPGCTHDCSSCGGCH